jgi:hypothetical protein
MYADRNMQLKLKIPCAFPKAPVDKTYIYPIGSGEKIYYIESFFDTKDEANCRS